MLIYRKVGTLEKIDSTVTQTKSYGDFVNRNAFLDQMEGVLSGKTGFTSKAGYCYVAALEQNGERYSIALLACGWPNNKTYKWHDARVLFTHGLETYDKSEVIFEKATEEVEIAGYINEPSFWGLNQNTILEAEAEQREYQYLMSAKEQLRIEEEWYGEPELPIERGSALGEYNVYLGEVKIDTIPLVAVNSGQVWGLRSIFEVILRQYVSVTS